MTHKFEDFFDTESIYWKKVLTIYEASDCYPKIVAKERNLHHKFPRSFSKKLGEEVDNDKDNLVSLSLPDHFLVHYYYWKCAKKGYRGSMALAFRFMAKKAIKYATDSTIEMMASDWAEVQKQVCKVHSDTIKKHHRKMENALKNRTTEEKRESSKKRIATMQEKYSDKELKEINRKKGDKSRGKTYEEIYGEKLAQKLRNSRSESNKKRNYSDFKHREQTILYACCETGEVNFMNYFTEKLNLKSKSSITNVLGKKDKRCRGFHWVKIGEVTKVLKILNQY